MSNAYQVRFKPTDGNGVIFQFNTEADTKAKALSKAVDELERRQMVDEYCLESISLVGDTPSGNLVPLFDIPMMSDERWNQLAEIQRQKHPDIYEALGY